MGYKIHYNNDRSKRTGRGKGRLIVLTVSFFLLFVLMLSHLAPTQLEMLRKMLFPRGDVDALLQDLREGEPISEAVSAFCQGIFHED